MKYLKSFIIFLSIFIFLFLLTTTLSYFDIISQKTTIIFNILSIIIPTFISNIYIGLKSTNKGYLEGLKLGGIILLFILITSILILKNKLTITNSITYFFIIILSVTGSIIGINKKKKNTI